MREGFGGKVTVCRVCELLECAVELGEAGAAPRGRVPAVLNEEHQVAGGLRGDGRALVLDGDLCVCVCVHK